MVKCLSLSLLVLVSLSGTAAADHYSAGDILVKDPWSRSLPEVVKNGAAYMELANRGSTADRLLSCSSPIATRAELHGHMMEGGMMKMRPVKTIEVTPGEPLVLKPGGVHIMLIGLKEPLVKGKVFPLTLNFERAGSVEIKVKVKEGYPDHGNA
jgi:periplasmic copper chaperone A